jgi:hypothetical protein
VDWPTIVEFFTKRGRPLSKDEISKLVEEDRKEREAVENKKRADEEGERRRAQRIMGDLEEEEDFEAFEMRQMAADAVQNQEQEEYDRQHGGGGVSERSDEDSEYDDEDEDELERGPDGELLDDDDYDGNMATKESSSPGDNLSRAKLGSGEYVKRA